VTSHRPLFSSDDAPVLVGLMALVVVFGLGVGVGRWTGRAVMHTPPPAKAEVVPSVPLRCTNSASPKPWTSLDAEVAVHRAQVALDTALASAWVEKRMTQWTSYAQATLDLVRVCWR